MRILDPKWTHLADGYRLLQALQAKLEAEFGRAVRIGHRQKHRKELAEWQKKRRIFFALVALAVLSVITLCVLPFYFGRIDGKVAFILAYWACVVTIILVTAGVALRAYIREMVAGRPEMEKGVPTAGLLAGRWWSSLAQAEMVIEKAGDRGELDFLAQLDRRLSDEHLAVRGLLTSTRVTSDTDVLVVGPSGVWVFEVKHWRGAIVKQDGVWKQIQAVRGKMGKKHYEEKVAEQAPDDQWLRQAQEIVKTLQRRLPKGALPADLDPADLIQGGLVFTHPEALLDKNRIQGQTASYGPPKPWIERLAKAGVREGFSLEARLQVLDALIHWAALNEHGVVQIVSAEAEAQRIYDETAEELRGYVAELVK
jgi:hypothetical protein